MAIVGIDLGTTNSLAAVYKDGRAQLVPNQFGEFLTPSVVSVDKDGRAVVGRIAQERLVTQPQDTVARFKRKMGTDAVYNLGGRRFTPEALSACVIRPAGGGRAGVFGRACGRGGGERSRLLRRGAAGGDQARGRAWSTSPPPRRWGIISQVRAPWPPPRRTGTRRTRPSACSTLAAARSTSRWSTASTTWWASARWRAITIWAGATSTC